MDAGAVETILDALKFIGTGVAMATIDHATKNAIDALRNLVRRRLKRRPLGEQILDQYMQDPETWLAPLRKELVESGADQDAEIIQAAQQFVTLIGTQNIMVGKNVVQAQQIGQVVQADQISVQTGWPGEGLAPLAMDLRTFQQSVQPHLEEDGWRVRLTTHDRVYGYVLKGWEEVFLPDPAGRRRKVVIGDHQGGIDSVPVIRRRAGHDLGELARRFLLESYQSRNQGRLYRLSAGGEDWIRIGATDHEGFEARAALDELVEKGYARRDEGAAYVLTPHGLETARRLAEGKE